MSELVISAEAMPDRLALVPLLDPLTIMVPDFADPCGLAKLPRTVAAAYPADVWDTENSRFTHGRWQISFAGAYLYPMILVTSGEHRYQITSNAPGDRGGPCARCRAHADQDTAQHTAHAAARDETNRARRQFEAAATGAGRDRGYEYASYVDAYGTEHSRGPSVPEWYASVATFYLAGWDEGVQAYADERAPEPDDVLCVTDVRD